MPVLLGTKTVTTAGTRVPLVAAASSATPFSSLIIQAKHGNTGYIYVGDSTVSSTLGIEIGIPVASSTPPSLEISSGDELNISDLSEVYIDSSINGEGVNYLYVQR